MAAYWQQAASRFHAIGTDGRGIVDDAGLPMTLSVMAAQAEASKARSGSWATGLSSATFNAGSATAQADVDLGAFLLPPIGNVSNIVNVHLKVAQGKALGALSYYAQPVFYRPPNGFSGDAGQAGVLGLLVESIGPEPTLIGSATTSGWIDGAVSMPDVDDDGKTLLGIRMFAKANESADPNERLTSICILSKQDTAVADRTLLPEDSTTWPKLSLTAIASADRPDDVYSLKRICEQIDRVVAHYPRVLATKAYPTGTDASGTVTGSNSTKRTLSDHTQDFIAVYKIATGPRISDIEIRAYAEQTQNAGASSVDGAIEVYVDGDLANFTTVGAGDAAAWIPVIIPAGNLLANTVHEIEVRGYAGYNATSADTLTVYDLTGVHDEFDETEVLPGSETTPTRAVGSWWTSFQRRTPIVASHAGGSLSQRRSDVHTLASNAAFSAVRRSHLVLLDHLHRDANNLNESKETNPTLAASILGRARWTTSYGTDRVEIWAAVRRTATAEPYNQMRLYVYQDDTLAASLSITELLPTNGAATWRRLAVLETTEATDYTFDVRGVWADSFGSVPSTTPTDYLVMDGLRVVERIREDAPA